MRKSKLDNPRVKKRVIQKLVLGKSQTSIAKEVGVSQSRISRFASRDDIKPFLEKESMRLVELAPDALDNVEEAVKDKIKDIPKSNIKRRKFVLDASIDALKAVGIMPTNVQSQAILNIYQQNNLVMTPQLRELLDRHNMSLMFPEQAKAYEERIKTLAGGENRKEEAGILRNHDKSLTFNGKIEDES